MRTVAQGDHDGSCSTQADAQTHRHTETFARALAFCCVHCFVLPSSLQPGASCLPVKKYYIWILNRYMNCAWFTGPLCGWLFGGELLLVGCFFHWLLSRLLFNVDTGNCFDNELLGIPVNGALPLAARLLAIAECHWLLVRFCVLLWCSTAHVVASTRCFYLCCATDQTNSQNSKQSNSQPTPGNWQQLNGIDLLRCASKH